MEHSLTDTARLLNTGRINEGLQTLQNAISLERSNTKLAQALKNLEDLLIGLTKRNIKIEKYLNAA